MSGHDFERVSWHLLGEHGPVCKWCGEAEDEAVHVVADVSALMKVFDRAYEASSRLFGKVTP